MKKKYVHLKSLDWIGRDERFWETNFSYCALKTDSTGERVLTQTCDWTMCREILSNRVRRQFRHGVHSIDRNAVKLLIFFRSKKRLAEEIIEGNINRGLKIINFFEKRVGWSESRLFEVECENVPTGCFIYLLHGPKQWIMSAYAVSLYSMFFRLGKYKGFNNFNTYEQFVEACNELMDDAVTGIVDGSSSEQFRSWPDSGLNIVCQLYPVADMIIPFLENYRSLLRGRTRKDIFMSAASYDGISNLCRDVGSDRKLRTNFIDLRKKVGVKCKVNSLYTKAEAIMAERKRKTEGQKKLENVARRGSRVVMYSHYN